MGAAAGLFKEACLVSFWGAVLPGGCSLGGVLASGGCTLAEGVLACASIAEAPSSPSMVACFLFAKIACRASTCWPRPDPLPDNSLLPAAGPGGAGKARIPVGWAGAAVGSSGGAKGPGKPWSMPCGGWSRRGKEPGKPWPMLLPGNITNPGRGCSDCTWLAFCMFKRACR